MRSGDARGRCDRGCMQLLTDEIQHHRDTTEVPAQHFKDRRNVIGVKRSLSRPGLLLFRSKECFY
ncbi:hypothetical protein SBC2_76690 (plasmid) [Caballeronia sp. SBC2]|nr:hypothetical protein SBC2_76690 [Caballeronia sp. SBC2]